MARLKNKQLFPPGGYAYFQPETNWTAPQHQSFDATVQAIISHRRGNPHHKFSTDQSRVEWELEAYTVKRLQGMKGAQSFLLEEAIPGSPPSFPQPPPEGGVVAGAKKVAAGVGVLLDWLGDGAEPVEHKLAESRAAVCTDCPKNKPGGLLSFFTEKAAETIRKQLEIRKDLQLSTPSDRKLNVCEVCFCPLHLKVHVPIAHIKKHTSDEVLSKLPSNCWMPKEFTYK